MGDKESDDRRKPRRERKDERDEPKEQKSSNDVATRGEDVNAAGKARRKRGDDENISSAADTKTGWMNSPSKVNKGKNDFEEEIRDPNVNNADKHFIDNDNEIILIPDMDEDEGIDADQRGMFIGINYYAI